MKGELSLKNRKLRPCVVLLFFMKLKPVLLKHYWNHFFRFWVARDFDNSQQHLIVVTFLKNVPTFLPMNNSVCSHISSKYEHNYWPTESQLSYFHKVNYNLKQWIPGLFQTKYFLFHFIFVIPLIN